MKHGSQPSEVRNKRIKRKKGGRGVPLFRLFRFFRMPKKENEVGKYLDIIRRVEAEGRQPTPNPESIPTPDNPYASILDPLRARCPVHVPPERWQQAVADSDAFLRRWGEQAHALGWTARDLWGLHTPPKKPHATYSRLSRYDDTGLLWLLHGREVVALTDTTAAIRWPGGSITIYRKNNKPALGPLGDSLDEFDP